MGVRRGGGKAALVLGTVVLTLALASCASRSARTTQGAGGRSAGTTTTIVKTVTAYSPAGKLLVAVGDVGTGSCFTGSIAADVPGAYRCFAAGNKILDPCFAPPDTVPSGKAMPTSVACLTNPWSKATVITLTARLPVAQESGNQAEAPRPWALQLRNGVRCVAATGTVPTVHGVALTYQCADGAGAAIVNPSARALVVDYGRPSAASLTRLAVSTVWRG